MLPDDLFPRRLVALQATLDQHVDWWWFGWEEVGSHEKARLGRETG
jgi:hypothetical protein